MGYQAGKDNISGSNNLFIGNQAGESNTTGHDNVYLGYYAGNAGSDGSFNILLGPYAGGTSATPGSYNTILGYKAGTNNTSNYNTIIGYMAGDVNDNGYDNTFLGANAGGSNISGAYNTLVGFNSGGSMTIGDYNTYLGMNAGLKNEGDRNVFIGLNAGWTETNVSNTLIISNYTTTAIPLIYGYFDTGMLGIKRKPTANNLEVEGTASKTTAGSWLANSDYRIKTDISDIENAIETISMLHPVKFRYSEQWRNQNPVIKDKVYYNFIAQEYAKVFPESVQGSGEYIEGEPQEVLQMDAWNAQVVSIKAIQELIEKNKQLESEVRDLRATIEEMNELKSLKSRVEQLESMLMTTGQK
jgi:hypothetical protein